MVEYVNDYIKSIKDGKKFIVLLLFLIGTIPSIYITNNIEYLIPNIIKKFIPIPSSKESLIYYLIVSLTYGIMIAITIIYSWLFKFIKDMFFISKSDKSKAQLVEKAMNASILGEKNLQFNYCKDIKDKIQLQKNKRLILMAIILQLIFCHLIYYKCYVVLYAIIWVALFIAFFDIMFSLTSPSTSDVLIDEKLLNEILESNTQLYKNNL